MSGTRPSMPVISGHIHHVCSPAVCATVHCTGYIVQVQQWHCLGADVLGTGMRGVTSSPQLVHGWQVLTKSTTWQN